MIIAILGGTGATGAVLVTKALKNGHKLRVLARDPSKVKDTSSNLTIIKGDVSDGKAIAELLQDAEIVVITLGSRVNAPGVSVVQDGVKIVLDVIKSNQKLLFLTSGLCNEKVRGKLFFPIRWFLYSYALGSLHEDMDKANALLFARKDIEWTTLMIPMLVSHDQSVGYELAMNDTPNGTNVVTNIDVADALLELIEANGNHKTLGELKQKEIGMNSKTKFHSANGNNQLFDSAKQAFWYRTLGHKSPFQEKH